jgi:hypothetical protein
MEPVLEIYISNEITVSKTQRKAVSWVSHTQQFSKL